MAAVSAGLALGIAAAGTAYSVYQGSQASKAQKRAADVQRRQREEERARERRQQIAESRRRRATVVNAAAQTGTSGSSGEAGALGSQQTQLGGNLGFMNQGERRESLVEMYTDQANSASTRASTGSAIAGLSLSASSLFAPSSPTSAAGAKGPQRTGFKTSVPQSSGFVPSDTPGPRTIF